MTENKTTSFVFIEGGANWKFRLLSKPEEEKRAAHIVAFSAKRPMVSSQNVRFDAFTINGLAGRVFETSPDIAPLVLSVGSQYKRV